MQWGNEGVSMQFYTLEGLLLNTGGTWDEDVAEKDKKIYTNNLGWKALSFPSSSLLLYFQVFRFGELAARELLCSYFTASCAIKNTLSRATASRPRASFLRCISYFILYILRRDYPFFSGFSRMRFSLLLIIPAICKSSRLFKARSIWLFCMVS